MAEKPNKPNSKHSPRAHEITGSRADSKTKWIVQMGILLAIVVIFAFTPLGYLKIGAIEVTLMVVPVAIGAITLGPLAGAILGGAFGVTSFIQCFGMSAFGMLILSLNPVAACITCIVPRILCGLLAGWVCKGLRKASASISKKQSANGGSSALAKLVDPHYLTALATALLNTILFMGCLILLFWNNGLFTNQMNEWGIATDNIWAFLLVFVGLNGVLEAVINFVVAGTVGKILQKVLR